MPDLIIRPTAFGSDKKGRWALQLRDHGPAETSYSLIAYISDEMAAAIVDAGPAYFLFGDPRDKKDEEE